jgi:hypothetical protein
MSHNCHISNAAADVQGDAFAPYFNSGYLRIYDNTGTTNQPADADASLGSKVMLAELRFASTAVSTSVNGLLTFGAITGTSDIAATGTAYMYRTFKSDGTTPLTDGLCGTVGSGSDLELNALSLVQHAALDISSFTHTIPK